MSALKDLGAALLQEHALRADSLSRARHEQERTGRPLWAVLADGGECTDEVLFRALRRWGGGAVVSEEKLRGHTLSQELREAVPRELAEELGVLPLERSADGKRVALAMIDPLASLGEVQPVRLALARLGVVEVHRFLIHRAVLRRCLPVLYGTVHRGGGDVPLSDRPTGMVLLPEYEVSRAKPPLGPVKSSGSVPVIGEATMPAASKVSAGLPLDRAAAPRATVPTPGAVGEVLASAGQAGGAPRGSALSAMLSGLTGRSRSRQDEKTERIAGRAEPRVLRPPVSHKGGDGSVEVLLSPPVQPFPSRNVTLPLQSVPLTAPEEARPSSVQIDPQLAEEIERLAVSRHGELSTPERPQEPSPVASSSFPSVASPSAATGAGAIAPRSSSFSSVASPSAATGAGAIAPRSSSFPSAASPAAAGAGSTRPSPPRRLARPQSVSPPGSPVLAMPPPTPVAKVPLPPATTPSPAASEQLSTALRELVAAVPQGTVQPPSSSFLLVSTAPPPQAPPPADLLATAPMLPALFAPGTALTQPQHPSGVSPTAPQGVTAPPEPHVETAEDATHRVPLGVEPAQVAMGPSAGTPARPTFAAAPYLTQVLLMTVEALARELEGRLLYAGELGAIELSQIARRAARYLGLFQRGAEEIGFLALLYGIERLRLEDEGPLPPALSDELGWAGHELSGLAPCLRDLQAVLAAIDAEDGQMAQAPALLPLGRRIVRCAATTLDLVRQGTAAEELAARLHERVGPSEVSEAVLQVVLAQMDEKTESPVAQARVRRLSRDRRRPARRMNMDMDDDARTSGPGDRTDPDRDPDLTRELALPEPREAPPRMAGDPSERGDPKAPSDLSDPEIELTDLSDDGLEHYHSEET